MVGERSPIEGRETERMLMDDSFGGLNEKYRKFLTILNSGLYDTGYARLKYSRCRN